MKVESVDFFYLAMPTVTTAADGSQDALVVRVTAGKHEGWGECEASPLPSIAAFVAPMSHGACRPVSASVLGETLDNPDDIRRMSATVAYNSMDLLQAAHTWSGIEMAMWDLLGRAREATHVPTPGLSEGVSQTALCLGAVRSDAGRDPCARRAESRGGFPRRQVRLGAFRQITRGRRRPSRCRARRSRVRWNPAYRCRAGIRRGR